MKKIIGLCILLSGPITILLLIGYIIGFKLGWKSGYISAAEDCYTGSLKVERIENTSTNIQWKWINK